MVYSPYNPFSKLNKYELQHLASHLINVGTLDGKDINSLLAKETQQKLNAWYEAKEVGGNLEGFLNDISLAWEEADKEFQTEPAVAIGRQCRYALIASSVNSVGGNIPAKLKAALVENHFWTPAQGLAYAGQGQ
jgi:hypothetical protein